MALLAPRILAPPLLERDQLGAARLVEDFGGDGRAIDKRRANRGAVAIADHHHLFEGNDVAGLGGQFLDREFVIGGNAILLAARLDDSEHLIRPCSSASFGGAGRASWFQDRNRLERRHKPGLPGHFGKRRYTRAQRKVNRNRAPDCRRPATTVRARGRGKAKAFTCDLRKLKGFAHRAISFGLRNAQRGCN